MTHQPPAIGSFLRPIGRSRYYRYYYEIVRVVPFDHGGVPVDQWHCRRWAVDDDGQPFDDGLRDGLHYPSGLVRVLPGVWRDAWPAPWGGPIYYRLMPDACPTGQGELFTEAA